jgi:light-regulated signal transduction histidine kinase (bacteriophytochrome)
LNEDLRDLNATLEVRVAERTRELEAANEELLAFNHSVSHDLHAPLRAIVANTRMLCQDAEGVLDERLFERLRRTEENALKMGRLMDDLLSYSRLGKAAIRMARVDVSALASRIGADVSLRTPGKIEVQPGICVEGDPEMIEIVLRNLIENAWKYVDAGVPPIVEVGMTGDGAVFVRDHGIGFDMKYIDQVWEPFARLHSSREYPGSGIGLANSKRIIQRHGGRLWAESAPGKGTTFYFVLGEPGFFAHEELGGNSARLR